MARILIFEPHPDIRALLELVIRRLGHEPTLFEEGVSDPAAVEAAVIEPGEGVGMPLARELRRRDRPVIFASIFPADQELLALEPAAYLVKPFSLSELESALGRALARLVPAGR
jgi:DNA-binding response OmpR family regulator